jgi:hypothetical protein
MRVELVTNGPLTTALGVTKERSRWIEENVQRIIEVENGSIRTVIEWFNEQDLPANEYVGAVFDLGYFNGRIDCGTDEDNL